MTCDTRDNFLREHVEMSILNYNLYELKDIFLT